MKKSEMIQIITLLAGNYKDISNKNDKEKTMMLNTWYECLGDLDYNLVLQAVKKTIIESPYMPTIHEVRKNAMGLVNATTKRTGIEAWEEAYKMICNGTYMTQEEFDKHSPEVKKFFGSKEQLKAYATNTEFNMDVVRSNFLRQYDVLVQRQKQEKLLPEKMQNMINGLIENMDKKLLN